MGAALSCFAAAIYFNLFDGFAEFAQLHPAWRLEDLSGTGFFLGLGALLLSLRRVMSLRTAREEAHKLARTDELTGLPNRRQFLEELGLWKERLHNEKCAVFLLDLDDFKPINDLYGHRLGDEVLRATAARIKQILGDCALLARMGGDEFGILLPIAVDEEAPLRVARSIVAGMQDSFRFASLSVRVGVSVGVSICSPDKKGRQDPLIVQDGSSIETALRQADMALYQAKESRSGFSLFCNEMDEQLRQRVDLEREIGPAIKAGQIIPYYQPLVDLRSGAVIGCEALARWEHPKRGLLPPSIFIPIAQNTGNISELTFSLLHQALDDVRTWPGTLSVAVNLSPRMLTNSLTDELLRILAEHSFSPHRLELEITETTLIERANEANATLETLRRHGISLALDDFGAGYAGLGYLRQFEFDRVKIDSSFITEMLANPRDLKIIETIINFCHSLGLQTTAEGIESFEISKRLRELGCNSGQGYLFCRPKPNSEILDYLKNAVRTFQNVG
jgi:diguanylate cyclase (GGDEF)-like protein